MATSYTHIRITSNDWTDIVSLNANLASVALTVQNLSSKEVKVHFGGAAAPTTASSGNVIGRLEGVNGTGANIWVKGIGPYTIAPLEND